MNNHIIKLNENDLKNIIKGAIFEYTENEIEQIEIKDFTKTTQFKNWFGNSKIVDSNGEPLPLYHGSPLGGIQVFKNKYNRGSDTMSTISSGLKEFGICFTTNTNLATKYKTDRKLNPTYVENIKIEIEKLTDVLYNVRNNREYNQLNDEIQKLKHKLQGGVYQTYLKMENPYIFDAKGKDGYNGWKELKINIGYKTAVGIDAIEAISGNNDMYKSNYDGIIAKNIIDLHLGDTNYSKYNQFMGDVYMVFSTSQTMIEKEI